jgi:beta-glucosidase-like glycosyl hydrolase
MCAYNAVNGEPSCASAALLGGLLRQGLGFEGYVASDCNAVAALTWGHATAPSLADAAGSAVRAGVDLLCDRPGLVRMGCAARGLHAACLLCACTAHTMHACTHV